jgi:hypothetical protein
MNCAKPGAANAGRLPEPKLSVVIVADRYETVGKTVNHLRDQSIRDYLEIVIVTDAKDRLDCECAEVNDFWAVRVIEVDAILPLALATAAGIRRARAPLVVLAESHAYPGAGWAQALIEAHQQPWAAVGAVIGNANPDSMISWASLFLDYGRCVETTATGVVNYLPGHHTSYKREILLQYDSQLEALMDSEILLHWNMRERGYQLYLDPAAKIYHVNISSLAAWLCERFYSGRRFAATRSQRWSLPRRLLYAAGAAFIPLLRLSRVLHDISRSSQRQVVLPRILPALFMGLVVSAAGEAAGYLLGAGSATDRLAGMELHKLKYVTKRDRLALEGRSIPGRGEPVEVHGH